MKQSAIVFIAAVLGVPAMASAGRDSFVPVGPPHRITFDTPDGHYQEWQFPTACPVNALRASVHFTRFGNATTSFSPGTNFFLAQGAEGTGPFAVLSFHARSFHPPFEITMEAGRGNRSESRLKFARQTNGGESFMLEMHWTYKGKLTGSAAGQEGSVQMPGKPENLQVTGFSGAGEEILQFGYMPTKSKDECRPVA